MTKFTTVLLLLILICFSTYSQYRTKKDTTKILPNGFMVLPYVTYNPETSLQYGLVANYLFNKKTSDDFSRPSMVSFSIVRTLKKQTIVQTKNSIYCKNGFKVDVKAKYKDYPAVFFGVGNNTKSGDEESYSSNFFVLESVFTHAFKNNRIFLGLAIDYFYIKPLKKIETDGLLASGNYSGVDGTTLLGVGPYFRFDSRDDILYPKAGFFFESKLLFYPDGINKDYSFVNLGLDFRFYRPLWNKKNIFTFQFFHQYANDKTIPFYKLNPLGRHDQLRGIHEERYIDKTASFVQTEYRRRLSKRFKIAVFTGIGDVAPKLNGYNFHDFKVVGGGGLRFKIFKDRSLHLRLDLGFCTDGEKALYFQIGEAF